MSFPIEPIVNAGVALGVTKIAFDSISGKRKKGSKKSERGKWVVVSGRSSHTVTAADSGEARSIFKKRFPYAHIRHVSRVKDRISA